MVRVYKQSTRVASPFQEASLYEVPMTSVCERLPPLVAPSLPVILTNLCSNAVILSDGPREDVAYTLADPASPVVYKMRKAFCEDSPRRPAIALEGKLSEVWSNGFCNRGRVSSA